MRANTKKHEMGRRFAILIGVAAVGVMALGAQTGTAASEGVVGYKTTLTIYKDGAQLHGQVRSGVRECWEGREVIVFKKRPGADRKLGDVRSGPQAKSHNWRFWVKGANKEANEKVLRDLDVYAKVTPKVGDGFVCRADTSGMLWKTYPPSMRATGDPVDSTPPDLQISGPKKQSPQNAKPTKLCAQADPRCPWAVDVRMSCGEGCSAVRATGRLTNVKRYKLTPFGAVNMQAGGPFHVGPLLWKEGQRREVRQALANGENVKAKVTVRVTDEVGQAAQIEFTRGGGTGNVATAKRTITLVK